MSNEYTIYNLQEAVEEIEKTIQELKRGTSSSEPHLLVNFEHLYHHINTAWNSRSATNQETTECSEENFENWRQFPKDIDLSCN